MNFLWRWMWHRTIRSELLSLYRRGMKCVEKQDRTGAMDAFAAVIERPEAPDDLVGMALYNRALLFAAAGDPDRALADLNAVMELPIPLHGVKLAARRRLDRLRQRQDATDRAHGRPNA
jgi:hypothetical protein